MVGHVLTLQFIVVVHIFIINAERNFLALAHKWKTQLAEPNVFK